MENINPTRVIVGFRADYDLTDIGTSYASEIDKATSQLSFVGGFIKVLEKFKYLNAVVVSIRPEKVHTFVADVIRIDPVEYCDYDYKLIKTYFDQDALSEHVPTLSIGQVLANYHGLTLRSSPRGVGARVALIDTGISPHPYLPSISPTEAIWRTHLAHTWLLRDPAQSDDVSAQQGKVRSLVDNLAQFSRNAVIPRDTSDSLNLLRSHYDDELSKFIADAWKNWKHQLGEWQQKKAILKRPLIPIYPNVLGSLRLISPLSRSFLPVNPTQPGTERLLDVDGHGTAMAGILAALPPRTFLAPTWDSLVALQTVDEIELNAFGVAPFCELVSLKCMHKGSADLSSSTVALIKALEYAADIDCDVIYIGLSLDKAQHKYATAIQRALLPFGAGGRSKALLVAPAGNEGTAGLNLPASSPGVLSVSATSLQPSGGLARSPNSNSADSNFGELLSFCAFGGSESNQVLLPSNHFGWTPCYGTSIAAAIAAGVLAVRVGEERINKLMNLYNNLVTARGVVVGPEEVRAKLAQEDLSRGDMLSIVAQLQNSARTKRQSILGFTEQELGSGPVSI